jgi:endonuclease YncB( thermonuclease family)
MKRIINFILIFLIYTMGLCFSSSVSAQEPPPGYCDATTSKPSDCKRLSPTYTSLPKGAQKVRVQSVYDGDTLTLDDERRVRFRGIDTPEMKPLQPFAKEAKEYTKSRCNQKEVWLLVVGKDHYNRLLGHVFVQESRGKYLCVNEGLVHEGFANAYTPKKSEKPFNWDKLLNLQSEARRSKRGIWKSFRDELVFKTVHGSAYHQRSCPHLSKSRNLQQLKISEASDLGLHPCRTCMG